MLLLALALLADPPVGKPVTELPPLWPEVSAISPNHADLAIALRDNGVLVLGLEDRSIACQLASATARPTALAWSSDSRLLAILRIDGSVLVLDANSGVVQTAFQTDERPYPECMDRRISFANGNASVVLGLGGGRGEIWNLASGSRVTTLVQGVSSAMSVSSDGGLVALGDTSGTVDIWDTRTGQLVRELRISDPTYVRGSGIHALDFSQDGRQLAIAGAGASARLWNFASDGSVRMLDCGAWYGPLEVGHVAFSKDGQKLLATTFPSFDAIVWNVGTCEGRRVLTFCGGFAIPVRGWISGDGSFVALGSGWPVVEVASAATMPDCVQRPAVYYDSDGDFAWAVVDHELIVRRIPSEKPMLRVRVRER